MCKRRARYWRTKNDFVFFLIFFILVINTVETGVFSHFSVPVFSAGAGEPSLRLLGSPFIPLVHQKQSYTRESVAGNYMSFLECHRVAALAALAWGPS